MFVLLLLDTRHSKKLYFSSVSTLLPKQIDIESYPTIFDAVSEPSERYRTQISTDHIDQRDKSDEPILLHNIAMV